jgi:diguanylate cyclase (GGDEF)-like protein
MVQASEGDAGQAASAEPTAEAVAAHVKALLFNPRPPELTDAIASVPDMPVIHDYLIELRNQLGGYARGDFSAEIRLRGVVAGMVKSLQANMQHLIWQMQQIEKGDLTQRVDFMGEFSLAFNKMVKRLDDALNSLRQKEEELVAMTEELELEVEKRGAALAALQKSEESFKYLAEHDPLTGLLNRRSFFARADMELARGTIMDNHGCVALMDVDHFKVFNDTYGHPNGDIALRHIADIGCAALRDADIMGRYGGEEFIFFFAKANQEQGVNAAERIRKVIAGTPVRLPGQDEKITASFGVVSIPPGHVSTPGLNLMEFAVSLADIALYRAKSQGRDMVCVEPFPAALPRESLRRRAQGAP